MFKSKELVKIRVMGVKSSLKLFISELHSLKLMHLTDFKKDSEIPELDIGDSFGEAEEYSRMLIDLGSLIDNLNLNTDYKPLKPIDKTKVRKTISELKDLLNKKHSLASEQKILQEEIRSPASLFTVSKSKALSLSKSKAICGLVPVENMGVLKKELPNVQLNEKDFDKKQKAVLLFYLNENENFVQGTLQKNGFSEQPLLENNLVQTKKRLSSTEDSLKKVDVEIEKIVKREEEFLVGAEKALSVELDKAEAPLKFAFTDKGFLVRGWIPEDKLDELQNKIKSINGLHLEAFDDKDGMPVMLSNPKQASSFEFFLRLYTLPQNYEIDPTILIGLTFPLFFGFMLGDVGYGLVVLAIIFLLRNKFKGTEAKSLMKVMQIASLAAVVFGFIYGEFFGFIMPYTPLLHRGHEIDFMLMLSILIGVIHINLGLILGFINVFSKHGIVHAMLEKGSWLLLEIAIGIGLLVDQTAGLAVGVIAVLMLLKAEGPIGLIEIPSLFGNILSYARLFALGLASLMLAEIINQLATPMFLSFNPLLMIAGIFILLAGHGINIFLGVLGPFIQSIRLEYVEFFGKFFKGGGKEFKPFGA